MYKFIKEFNDRTAKIECFDVEFGNVHTYNTLEHNKTMVVKNKKGEVISIQNILYKESTYKVIYNENLTIVILDGKYKGISRCHPKDENNRQTGFKIAFNRAKIKQLQDEIKELSGK